MDAPLEHALDDGIRSAPLLSVLGVRPRFPLRSRPRARATATDGTGCHHIRRPVRARAGLRRAAIRPWTAVRRPTFPAPDSVTAMTDAAAPRRHSGVSWTVATPQSARA